MPAKTQHLQIRVSPEQKARLKRAAARAGLDVSGYVLGRALPAARTEIEGLLASIRDPTQRTSALAALNDLLTSMSGPEFVDAVESLDVSELSALDRNYVAAMVELAAYLRCVPPPGWPSDVEPLPHPYFATTLVGLRPHLLRASPVPFKRRNIFIDSSLGSRV